MGNKNLPKMTHLRLPEV